MNIAPSSKPSLTRRFACQLLHFFGRPAAPLACLALIFLSTPTQAETNAHLVYVWNPVGSRQDQFPGNDNDSFFNELNWLPNGIPGTNDAVIINAQPFPFGGPNPIDGALELFSLEINNSILRVGTLVVNRLFQKDGQVVCTDRLTFHGRPDCPYVWSFSGGLLQARVRLPLGGAAEFRGPSPQQFGPGTFFENETELFWSGGDINVAGGALLENRGRFLISTDRGFYNLGGGNGRAIVRNLGLLRKTGGTGTTEFGFVNGGVMLTNAGILSATEGTLACRATAHFGPGSRFNAGGGHGIVSVESFGGDAHFYGSNTVDADGILRLATTATAHQVEWSGQGIVQFDRGSISGDAWDLVDPSLRLRFATDNDKVFGANLRVRVAGTTFWDDRGAIHLSGQSTFTNLGTFIIRSNATFQGQTAVGFVNLGIVRKIAGNGVSIWSSSVPFNGTGTLDVQSGEIAFQGGANLTNVTLLTAANTALSFPGNVARLFGAASLAGPGRLRWNGASVNFSNATLRLGPGSTVEFDGSDLAGDLALLSEPASPDALPGAFRWTRGFIRSGNFLVGPGLDFAIATSTDLGLLGNDSTLTNRTTARWTGPGHFLLEGAARLVNEGVWECRNDRNLGSGASARVINHGVFRKVDSTNQTTFGRFALHNVGAIEVHSGTLEMLGHSTNIGARFFTASNATLRLRDGTMEFRAGAGLDVVGRTELRDGLWTWIDATNHVDQDGRLAILSGTTRGRLAIDGAGVFQFNGDGFFSTVLEGQLTALPTLAAFELGGSSPKIVTAGGAITNFARAIWIGTGNSDWGPGAALVNHGSIEFQSDAAFNRQSSSSPAPVFINEGTLRKTAGIRTHWSGVNGGVTLVNRGELRLERGAFELNSAFLPTAESVVRHVVASSDAIAGYGQLARVTPESFPFLGTLMVELAPGFVPTNGTTLTLARYSARNGQYAPVMLPALPPPLRWSLAYRANELQLQVSTAPTLSTPTRLANGQIQFAVEGPAASAVVIEASTNLTQWTPLATNAPFHGTFSFTDINPNPPPARYYRFELVP